MPRGGKRPGAGAPKGNTNALKHGATSELIRKAVENALADPKGRVLISNLVRRFG